MSAQQSTAPDPTAYGEPISAERQAELQAILDAWNAPDADHGERSGPFDKQPGQDFGVKLTGADVGWLAEPSGRDVKGLGLYLPLHGANLGGAHLEGANLDKSDLPGANLVDAHLEGALLRRALLSDARLEGAHLEGADLGVANLPGAHLTNAHLEGADLRHARLDGAYLDRAHLQGADLRGAHLVGAYLDHAHLEGAELSGAHLSDTHFRYAWMDSSTMLRDAGLDDTTQIGDIQWSGVGAVNLTQIDWSDVPRLGDETALRHGEDFRFGITYEAAVRAYRQLAAQLRAQGLSEVADRFSERAQITQRRVLLRRALAAWRQPWRLPGAIGRYLGSLVLALLAGYGYRPGRTILWYAAVVVGFTVMYMQATQGWVPFGLPHPSALAPLPWYESLILSVSAFHGRGFFQPLQSLGDPIAALAALEAVVGLLIEISFIATFTQRFFGAK